MTNQDTTSIDEQIRDCFKRTLIQTEGDTELFDTDITVELLAKLISDQVAKATVDPKLSAAELALEYIQEHKDSKQSGELVGVTNFIGWLSEKARIATLTNDKEQE